MFDRAPRNSPLRWPAVCLGISLGGFFDGILLHQVLQWHHLLSEVDAVRDVRTQILADGLFHALMYVIGAAAIVLLWRRRAALAAPMAARVLQVSLAAGFGLWHVADAILSHGLLRIHRVRGDATHPLAWDLLWLAVFGIAPLLLAWWLHRRAPPPAGPGDGEARRAGRVAVAMGLAAGLAGPLAALPPSGAGQTVVVFGPGVSSARAFNALGRVDARIVWNDAVGGVWLVEAGGDPQRLRALYADGALLVTRSAIGLGCASWTRASAA